MKKISSEGHEEGGKRLFKQELTVVQIKFMLKYIEKKVEYRSIFTFLKKK